MSAKWYLTEKSYFSGFEREEIEKTYDTFDEFLSQSPETYPVVVNDIDKFIIVQSTSDYNERRILMRHDDIKWGDIVLLDGEKWLVTDRPFYNKIHDKSHIQLCNNEMNFTYLTEGIFERDRLGNKIWIEEPTEVTTLFPCVIESISSLNTKVDTGQQVNVPEGDMVLQIQYTTSELIRINNEFTVFGDNYRISGIDRSKIHNDKGVLVLIVSRGSNNT